MAYNGMKFSTQDVENDRWIGNCAQDRHGTVRGGLTSVVRHT